MRRFINFLLLGPNKMATRKQKKSIDNLGLRRKSPYLLTKQKASKLIEAELNRRKWKEAQRIAEEKRRQARQHVSASPMREALLDVEDRWQSRADIKERRIEEEAARELEEIKRNNVKRKYTRKR